MIRAVIPAEHRHRFVPYTPFPEGIVAAAEAELDLLAAVLTARGVRVHRPESLDWHRLGGYTGAMPRDGFLALGNRVIEAPMAWRSRRQERKAYLPLFKRLVAAGARWMPTDIHLKHTTPLSDAPPEGTGPHWAIDDARPAWDAADFLRIGGGDLLGQLSHVTNRSGVADLQQRLGPGHRIHLVAFDDPHAMHIDASLCPLRDGLALYNPERVTPGDLRHTPLRDWDLVPAPTPAPRTRPPLFMTSTWVGMNLLVIDGKHVGVEASDEPMHDLLHDLGFQPVPCPFRHVQSLGGSFHCATLDLRRASRPTQH